MTTLDLNADMGEGFGAWRIGGDIDDRIMAGISSANIATGFHAGDPTIMTHSLQQAAKHGVAVGAHPGFRDLVGFGRRHIHAAADEPLDNDRREKEAEEQDTAAGRARGRDECRRPCRKLRA